MSEIETTVTLDKAVAALRTSLKELSARQKDAIAAHDAASIAWRKDFLRWLAEGAPRRVKMFPKAELRRYGQGPLDGFLDGAPPPPKRLDYSDRLRKVRAALKQLSIAQPKSVRITTEWVEKYLSVDADEES